MSDDCTCQGFRRDFRCPEHGDGIFKRDAREEERERSSAKPLEISVKRIDELLKMLDDEINFLEGKLNATSYRSEITVWKRDNFKEIREVLRAMRQQKQMTGMSGNRIEE